MAALDTPTSGRGARRRIRVAVLGLASRMAESALDTSRATRKASGMSTEGPHRDVSRATEITALLQRWSNGDSSALDLLMPLVYDELRRVAHRRLAAERSAHTLQTTALVHEAYARLAGSDLKWTDRAHFFALAARTMRRVLVDYARTRSAEKRGGGAPHISLDRVKEGLPGETAHAMDILALHEALEALERQDERKARVVEAHIFGGLTYDETAAALDISAATVDRELRLAKAWLARELS